MLVCVRKFGVSISDCFDDICTWLAALLALLLCGGCVGFFFSWLQYQGFMWLLFVGLVC
jgi:hypothetical protein